MMICATGSHWKALARMPQNNIQQRRRQVLRADRERERKMKREKLLGERKTKYILTRPGCLELSKCRRASRGSFLSGIVAMTPVGPNAGTRPAVLRSRNCPTPVVSPLFRRDEMLRVFRAERLSDICVVKCRCPAGDDGPELRFCGGDCWAGGKRADEFSVTTVLRTHAILQFRLA